MTRTIPRRTVIAAGPLALAGCAYEGPYFGGTSPPSRQRLIYANGNEPDVFDPGTYAGGTEMRIINALFDGLTKFHPVTLEPMAALAVVDPRTGSADANYFYYIENAEEIHRGKRQPEDLGRCRSTPHFPTGRTRSSTAGSLPPLPLLVRPFEWRNSPSCEAMLLRAMPFVPLYFDTWAYLERPEIHGLGLSPLGMPAFKYAWIDTNWGWHDPQASICRS